MRRSIPFAVLAALAACSSAESAGGGGGPGGGGFPPMPVEVAEALRDTVVEAISATGQIEAVQAIELRPEVDGRIVEIVIREGAEVARGAPLIRIDDAELKQQAAAAEAERDLARQALQRTRLLLEQNASSSADLERAEATSRSAEARYELLRLRLDRAVVRAPFAGVVGQRFVSLGDYVTSATPLLALQTFHPQRAVFQVPERHAEQLRRGQTVRFRVAALPGREFTGVVDFVDPVVDPTSRQITVKAEVPNAGRLLQAGMFLDVRLATEVRPQAVVVPEEAAVPVAGSVHIWVAVDGKATRREVELGVRTPGFVEVRRGIAAGEQVVVGGQARLAEGAPVAPQVVERKPVRPAERR